MHAGDLQHLDVLPARVAAIELGEWIPGLKLRPGLSERVEYETNVFQVRSKSQDDVISRTIPGFVLDYKFGRHSLDAGYRAEILRFMNFPGQDTEHHIGLGQLKLDFPRLLLQLRDSYTRTSDPPNSELTGRVKSTTNFLAPDVAYRLSDRFSTGVNYSWTRVDFDTVDQLNRDENLVGVSLFWKFVPKADLQLNYSHGRTTFDTDTDRDVTRNLVTLGLKGDLTAKLTSTFSAGYEVREPGSKNLEGFSGYILGGNWEYRPTDRTTVSLATSRRVEESTFSTATFFISNLGTLTLAHAFVPKVSASLRLTVGENEYSRKTTLGGQTKFRNDILTGWGGEIRYDLQRWLRMSLEYSHTRRTSNFNVFNFADDKIAGMLTLEF
jgi:hypothetical protein